MMNREISMLPASNVLDMIGKKAARARHQVNKSQRKSGSSQEAVSIRSRLDDEAQAPARGEKNVREQA